MPAGQHLRDPRAHRFGPVGNQQILPRRGAHALERLGRGDDGAAHRHGFQHLVLDAPGDAERRHAGVGVGEVGPHVRHPPGHAHAGPARQPQHRRAGVGADDVELGRRVMPPEQRERLGREPADRVGIGPVVHVAGEHQMRPGCLERRLERLPGREAVEVHAVLHRMDAARGLRRQPDEAVAFLLRHEQRGVAAHRGPALVGQQRPAFPRPDRAHGEPRVTGVGGPLLRVDVLRVKDQAGTARAFGVGRHGDGVDVHDVHVPPGHAVPHPAMQARVPVVVEHQGPARAQGRERPELLPPPVDGEARNLRAPFAHRREVLHVAGFIDQAAEVDAERP